MRNRGERGLYRAASISSRGDAPIDGPAYRPPPESPSYRGAWKARRRRIWFIAAVFALYLPVMALLAIIAERIGAGALTIVGSVVWMLLFCAAASHHGAFRCPGCGHRFYGERGITTTHNPWA